MPHSFPQSRLSTTIHAITCCDYNTLAQIRNQKWIHFLSSKHVEFIYSKLVCERDAKCLNFASMKSMKQLTILSLNFEAVENTIANAFSNRQYKCSGWWETINTKQRIGSVDCAKTLASNYEQTKRSLKNTSQRRSLEVVGIWQDRDTTKAKGACSLEGN